MMTVGRNCTLNGHMITAPGLMFSLSNVYENNHIGEKEAKQGHSYSYVKMCLVISLASADRTQ